MRNELILLNMTGIGTLLVAMATMLWEQRHQHRRRVELRLWVAAWAALASGCALAALRGRLPGFSGWAASNIAFVCGYLLLLAGVARPNGRRPVRLAIAVCTSLTVTWALFGVDLHDLLWNHVASAYIAVICGFITYEIWTAHSIRHARSRPVSAAVALAHGGFNVLRALAFPLLIQRLGPATSGYLAVATMYEGVIFSVAMPMMLLALVREEAFSRLTAELHTDYLTGLSNRQHFFESGQRLLDTQPPAVPIRLLALDLDHFKAINDLHGHAAGDDVLRHFARLLRKLAGPDTLIARLGGEEFAILLPGLSEPAALSLGEDIAQRFAAMRLEGAGSNIHTTVSIGLAARDTTSQDLTELLCAADRALYRAKAMGRNRVEGTAPAMVIAHNGLMLASD